MATNNNDKITNIVVLMFENRSFDHIFGALPGVNGLFKNGQINQDYYNLPDPLSPPSPSNLPVYPAPVDASLPQQYDFNHNFGDGMMPDLFGPTFTVSGSQDPNDPLVTYSSGYVNGAPTNQVSPLPQTYPATNSGFYSTYRDENNQPTIQGQAALSYFEDGSLQVLHTLAKEFVLCDNWHCDLPGHTEPNRCFIHAGTSGSVGIDDGNGGTDTSKTIYEVIDESYPGQTGKPSWKMYAPIDKAGKLGQLDTAFLNSNVSGYKGASTTDFLNDCNNGTLPFYSFIMCWLPVNSYDDYTDTSMHPNALIQPGENLLAGVYNALRGSAYWENTLLVVTFDENGGIYDHVFPPTTTPPDPAKPVITQSVPGADAPGGNQCGNQWTMNSQFDFSLLGPRIPAMLISPWLTKGIDSNQYQNTSVVRYIIDKINTINGTTGPVVPPLTQRDATAPSLDSAFAQFSAPTMRTDCPVNIPGYTSLPSINPNTNSSAIPFSGGNLASIWAPPSMMSAAKPLPHIPDLMNSYVAPLPGHPDSGKPITQQFATNADAQQYTDERLQAAQAYYAQKGK